MGKNLNQISRLLFTIGFLLSAIALSAWADNPPLTKRRKLPSITLPIPGNPTEKSYLGLSRGGRTFKLHQIKAQAVIIKVFNIYCPGCQATATAMTELYHRIQNDPDLRNKIRLIGIGAGNTPYEIKVFRETHKIPFPIFADEDFTIYHALGETKTPYIIAARINRDGSQDVVYTQPGALTEAGSFLELILDAFMDLNKSLPPLKKRETPF